MYGLTIYNWVDFLKAKKQDIYISPEKSGLFTLPNEHMYDAIIEKKILLWTAIGRLLGLSLKRYWFHIIYVEKLITKYTLCQINAESLRLKSSICIYVKRQKVNILLGDDWVTMTCFIHTVTSNSFRCVDLNLNNYTHSSSP